MPTASREQVLQHIQGGRPLPWITTATGWKADSIVGLAEMHRWKQIADGTFRQMAPPPAPPAAIPIPADRLTLLLDRAAKSVSTKTVNLGAKVAVLIRQLEEALGAEEAAVAARAEVERLEQELAKARARAGITAAPKGAVNYPAAEVRAWARANGYQVKDIGLIKRSIVDAWRDAQASS